MRDFQFLSGFSLLLVALASVGCNLVLGIGDFKDEGQGGNATGGSNPGGTPDTGGDAPNGGGGAGASGGGGGGGGTCSEDPCKLVAPQCGCDADQACTLDASGLNRVCGPAGSAMGNQGCDGTTLCAPGLFCNGGFCSPFCVNDDPCIPLGTICALQFSSGDLICSDLCDPLSNFGEGCAPSSGCYLNTTDGGVDYLVCAPNGGVLDGDPCTQIDDCLPGSGCYNDGVSNKCLHHCRVDTGAPCPGSCLALDITINGVAYGACAP